MNTLKSALSGRGLHHSPTRRVSPLIRHVMLALAGLLGTAGLQTAFAQPAPGWTATRPIRMIVPFPAGGGSDVVARIIAAAVGNNLGQPIIVENKSGASGAIGSEFVYNAAPDGQVIEMASVDTNSIYPHVYEKARFKPTEFTAIASVVKINFVLMGRPGLPAKTLSEVVALSRQQRLTYATYGVGTISHVAMAKLISQAKLAPMTDVPYKGAGPAAQALMGSEVDLMMVPAPLAVSFRSKLTVIGIASPARFESLKDVPTLGEQGVNIDTSAWIGIVAPPKMPAHIADAISRRVAEAMADPTVQKRLQDQAMVLHAGSRAQFETYLNDEYRKWGETVREANIKLEE